MKNNIKDVDVLRSLINNLTVVLRTSRGEAARVISTKDARKLDIFTDLGLDSIEALDLLTLLECEFKIKIDASKVKEETKLGDLEHLIKQSIAALKK